MLNGDQRSRQFGKEVQDFWDYSKKFVLNAKLKDQMKSYDEEAIRLIPKNKIEKSEESYRES